MGGHRTKIEKVFWNSGDRVLLVYYPDAILAINFYLPRPYIHQRNKWLGWKNVSHFFKLSRDRKEYNPQPNINIPIRNLDKFLEELIQKFKGNTDIKTQEWINENKSGILG